MSRKYQKSAIFSAIIVLAILQVVLCVVWWQRPIRRGEGETLRVEFKINVNTASEDELQVLPRIGPALAKAIVKYRQEHGPFETYEQMDDVPRIGAITRARFQLYICLSDDVYEKKKPPSK